MNNRIQLIPALCVLVVSQLACGIEPDIKFFDQDLLNDPPIGDVRVRLTEVAQGLNGTIETISQVVPTDFEAIPDGSSRSCVLTLGGVIRLIQSDSTMASTPFFVTANNDTYVEPANFGIISMAFHPEYAEAGMPGFGKMYVIETEFSTSGTPDFDGSLQQVAFGGVHHDVLYEYTTNDPSADVFAAASRREILRVEQPGWDHNLFDLVFDASGNLFITSGDGANASPGTPPIRDNAQYLGNVFGKVLRIDPLGSNSANGQYGIPADNPFVGNAGALPEIYSYGHRSPYRLTIDRQTNNLWLGEVGQRQIEEVNLIHSGANYGWPFKEGSFLFDELDHDNNSVDPDLDSNGNGDFADANGLTDPIFELDHQTARSVTGGYIYRSQSIPGLKGRYVFTDAFGNGLFFADPANGPVSGQTGGVQRFMIDPTGEPMSFGTISVGQDIFNELYLLTADGRVLRLDPWPCSSADLVPDGTLDFLDISEFLNAYSTNNPTADLNNDMSFDFLDISDFLASFAQGCPG